MGKLGGHSGRKEFETRGGLLEIVPRQRNSTNTGDVYLSLNATNLRAHERSRQRDIQTEGTHHICGLPFLPVNMDTAIRSPLNTSQSPETLAPLHNRIKTLLLLFLCELLL